MAYATPAAQRRRLSRFPGPAPRSSTLAVPSPSTPAATPPSTRSSRKSRLSAIIYSSPDSLPSSPSLSAPLPFDWDAVRSNASPPYATPGKASTSQTVNGTPRGEASTSRKRVFRKPNLIERVRSIPSRVAFEISMFPHNVPMPPPKTTGQLIGGLMHVTHICVKWASRSTAVPKEDPDDIWKSEIEWDLGEEGGRSRWSWTTPIAFLLLLISVLNMLYMFTRIRTYQLHLRSELVKSPHASIVTKGSTQSSPTPESIPAKALALLIQSIKIGWRLAFGTSPSPEDLIAIDLQPGANKVQQLEVWNPGEIETQLLIVYSPAHFFAWRIFSSANWFSSFIILAVISLQLHTLFVAYEGLIKDRAILSAEVFHEYDTKFVNPRLHGLKRDVGTMTNEAEMVDNWRNYGYRE